MLCPAQHPGSRRELGARGFPSASPSLAPVRGVDGGNRSSSVLWSGAELARPTLSQAASSCWGEAAAAHVESWTSHFGSLSLKVLGGTEISLRCLLFYGGMFASLFCKVARCCFYLKKKKFILLSLSPGISKSLKGRM